MSRRISAVLAILGLALAGAVACVDVPDTMRAEFAGPGPNDRTNYKPGPHGAAPPNDTHFKIAGGSDAGAGADLAVNSGADLAVDAGATPLPTATPTVTDGGNS